LAFQKTTGVRRWHDVRGQHFPGRAADILGYRKRKLIGRIHEQMSEPAYAT
jgi:hypothetical protein